MSTVGKVPLLFLLTIIVTFPSLYVFNALVGSRLSLGAVFRLIVAAVAVMLAILASFGPIVAFFSVSTTSYPFMLLLNVTVFAVSGFLGLKFLLRTLHRLTMAQSLPASDATQKTVVVTTQSNKQMAPETVQQATPQDVPQWNETLPAKPPIPAPPATKNVTPCEGALDRDENQTMGQGVITVFYTWILVFGLVGAQMSWVLRPFIGSPDKPFVLFRGRESNFFEAVFNTLIGMLN
jgi:hypothetical protein